MQRRSERLAVRSVGGGHEKRLSRTTSPRQVTPVHRGMSKRTGVQQKFAEANTRVARALLTNDDESPFPVRSGDPNLPLSSRSHRGRLIQSIRRIRARDPNDAHPARTRRLNSCGRVLDHKTVCRIECHPLGPLQIRLRMRLPVRDIIRRNQNLGHRKSTKAQPRAGQQPRPRSHDAPPRPSGIRTSQAPRPLASPKRLADPPASR